MRLVLANQATAARRRVYFDLRDSADGITAETGEAGGQPQISTNGGAFTNTGIGTLTHIGNGRYYADLTQSAVATAGDIVETRYKSANTAESPGDSVQIVAFDPDDTVRLGLTSLPNAAAGANTGLPVVGTQVPNATAGANGGLPVLSVAGTTLAYTVSTVTTLTNRATADVTHWSGTAVATPDVAGYPKLSALDSPVMFSGTSQGAGAATINLESSAPATGDTLIGRTIKIYAGTGIGQVRVITAYAGSIGSYEATVSRDWRIALDGTSKYAVLATDAPKVNDGLEVTPNANATVIVGTMNPSTITSSTFAAGAITAAAIAADAIGASELAADAVAEIQSGLATSANQTTILSRIGTPSTSLTVDIAAVKSDTAAILDDTGTSGVVVASGSKTGYALSATGLALILIDGVALPTAIAYVAASTAGRVSGAGTATEVFLGLDEATTRLTITVDASGNRTDVVYG